MTLWIAVALLAVAVVAALAYNVRRAGGRAELLVLVALAVPAIALASYGFLGKPQLPDLPHASRTDAQMHAEMRGLLADLQRRLEQDPSRLDGWLLLARSHMQVGDYQQAAQAFQRALKLSGDNPGIAASLGEALIYAEDGSVSNDAREVLLFAYAKNPSEPKALFYLGHDAAARADHAAAVQFWINLISVAPADAPWVPEIRARLSREAAAGNIDLANVAPTVQSFAPVRPPAPARPAAPAPGPSAADVAAASEMPAEERAAFIRTMVERLEARLQSNPNDVDGWKRLANAWRVLGDTKKADEADARVRALESR